MKLAQFIIVDDTMNRKNRDTFEFTVNGDVIYPLETPLPVIRKGVGCIGIGIISTSVRKNTTTSITFRVSETNKDAAKAYYDLYRNQVSSSNSDDIYDNASDTIIPGMMMNSAIRPAKDESKSQYRRRRGQSLSDILRENDDWD